MNRDYHGLPHCEKQLFSRRDAPSLQDERRYKTPTQRIGIVPDIVATPTVKGIGEGRDEVLEAALRHLLGPEADPAAVRRMAAR